MTAGLRARMDNTLWAVQINSRPIEEVQLFGYETVCAFKGSIGDLSTVGLDAGNTFQDTAWDRVIRCGKSSLRIEISKKMREQRIVQVISLAKTPRLGNISLNWQLRH